MNDREKLAWICSEIAERISGDFTQSDIGVLVEQADAIAMKLGFVSGPLIFSNKMTKRGFRWECSVIPPEIASLKGNDELELERGAGAIIMFRATMFCSPDQGEWIKAKSVLGSWIRFLGSPDFNQVVNEIAVRESHDLTKLTVKESEILQAIQEINGQPTGEQIAEKAGYSFTGTFKTTLSELVKKGILQNHRPGYSLVE